MFKKDSLLTHSPQIHSPHNIIPQLIAPNSIVLDVGCNAGFLGKFLRHTKNCQTDGVDINDQALKKAQKNYRAVYKRDLYQPALNLGENKYDYIVFADVLEHLPRPDLLLIDAKKYLNKRGKIIVCMPNVARINIRLQILAGHFDYRPGILSEDHLRFFTKKTATAMLKKCGYKVEKVIPTGFSYYFYYYLGVDLWPELLAFSLIYVCKPGKRT